MSTSDIIIKGAREHNLQNIDLLLPRNELICLTGVSGSGKSSLAFDTLFAEGQRRYVESLSSFARHFLQQMPKPDVELISGLSPSISISQSSSGNNPRSTVGTITEIYDFLRVLFARTGQPYCPSCQIPISAQTNDQIVSQVMQLPEDTQIHVLAPVVRGQKGEHRDLFEDLLKQGYIRARVNGEIRSLNDSIQLERQMRHDIEVVIDRLVIKPASKTRVAEAVESAMKVGQGTMVVCWTESGPLVAEDSGETDSASTTNGGSADAPERMREQLFSAEFACGKCGTSFRPPTPQLFSFNSPQGMCSECSGLGRVYSFVPELLIPRTELSIKDGAVELLGKWKELGRWRRHIYQGFADTIERLESLPEGSLLESPWQELEPRLQRMWLYGSGDTHITFTWRGGASPMKYGGTFAGIVPELLERYMKLKLASKRAEFEQYMDQIDCASCQGARLNEQARNFRLKSQHETFCDRPELTLPEICSLSIDQATEFLSKLEWDDVRALIAAQPVKEILQRLGFLLNVGLEYLTLDRSAPTLSGGETQRIRLAGQIGAGLVGVLYILDEPSIGLHARDNDRLIGTLKNLRDLGNTVVVVEHDEDTMLAADTIIDFGPGPGVHGGHVVAHGSPQDVMQESKSVTGQFLAGKRQIELPAKRRQVTSDRVLNIRGARHNNLKNVDVDIPLGAFVCFTGVSGSGKSSIVNDILIESLNIHLNHGKGEPGEHDEIRGIEQLDKMIAIDQSPIGRTPRSNPGTYIKLFDEIRALYSQLPDAKRRGFAPGRFSFNVKGGRCEACEGNGSNKLEMDFLADIWVTCPVCNGARFNRETLSVTYKGKTIADVLEMDIEGALNFFENIPKIHERLKTLEDVGLDYLKIGQPSPTLSGGEAQRIKLARELVKKSTGQTLYLLDEPTTGLHFADIDLLLKVLHRFVDAGNTVVVVEHNLDVIKTADWIVDIGPEGGRGGGRVVCAGTPEQVAACAESYTGRALKRVLSPRQRNSREPLRKKARKPVQAKEIVVRGAHQHNLRGVDANIPRDQLTVFCGPSGSGKSSLAMDTIYAEGQRRYVESLSSYARQFVNQMEKPRVDQVEGLSPAIAIEQKNFGSTPRSTVGTITEIYDYLRILFARLGTPYCPGCERPIGTQTSDQVVSKIMSRYEGDRVLLTAPLHVDVSHDYDQLWDELRLQGFARVRVDGSVYGLEEVPPLAKKSKADLQVVIDRVDVKAANRARVAESTETALSIGRGEMFVVVVDDSRNQTEWKSDRHSQHLACDACGRSFELLSPHHFSFNSQLGWCPECEGLGVQRGANPALLIKNMESTLEDGALRLWPNLELPLAKRMLGAVCEKFGISLRTPFSQLDARKRRVLFYGTGETWFELDADEATPGFAFQFKGLYPALDEASRLSATIRQRMQSLIGDVECGACGGSRLRDDAAAVRFMELTIDGICRMPLGSLFETTGKWKLDKRQKKVAGELLREIQNRIEFLNDVGLEYLTLGRGSATLSNGEAQRIRLASQLGSGLVGVLYVLDEPTIGLHPRDNTRLLGALKKLRDLGNTLVVVEHDREVIEHADRVFDFGPKAGAGGGLIVAEGKRNQIERNPDSVTGPYLKGTKAIPVPTNRRPGLALPDWYLKASSKSRKPKGKKSKSGGNMAPEVFATQTIEILGARQNNLQNIDVTIPLQTLTVVTGPSGCGKSSLVNEVLYNSLARRLHMASTSPGACKRINGTEYINKVIQVDQSPLGNSPSSNPATYTGAFELIRMLFAELPDSKVRGYTARRFSFNVSGGRCENCSGNGQLCIEMHFLPDVWVECPVCSGQRYNEETLSVRYRGRSINDVLEMPCGEALQLFDNIPKIKRILKTLCDVGLDYVKLGQSAPTLSGGEAQRVKLAAELARPDTGRTLYVLDEPTTGLHFDDLAKLLEVLQRLVDLGNTVLLIEHNLDIIKAADWVIELGPEAGQGGGNVVVVGTPEILVEYSRRAKQDETLARCWTGEALDPVLTRDPHAVREPYDPLADADDQGLEIADLGRDAQMPWEIDGERWHTVDRVAFNGEPAKWDGRILSRVVERIEKNKGFAPTNWNCRSIVEVTGQVASHGWFLHALTGEQWLLKLKFRVRRGTFKKTEILERIQLKTANELEDLPIYGNQPRIRVSLANGWQEIELRLHTLEEIDHDAFWQFLDDAIQSFLGRSQPRSTPVNLAEVSPWAVLGRKWHLMDKGFNGSDVREWDFALLEALQSLLESLASEAEQEIAVDWGHKMAVKVNVGEGLPWISLYTKRHDAIWIQLNAPVGHFSKAELGRAGKTAEIIAGTEDSDIIRIAVSEQGTFEGLRKLLQRHLANQLLETR